MSKEELAQEHHFIQTGLSVGKNQSHADLTLEYAKEQAIGFAEWIMWEVWQQYDIPEGWLRETDKTSSPITSNRLYELYLSTLKK